MSKSQKIPLKGVNIVKAQVFELGYAPVSVSLYEVLVDSPIPQVPLFIAAYNDHELASIGDVAYGSGRTPQAALEAAAEVWQYEVGAIGPNPFLEAIKRFQAEVLQQEEVA